MNVNDEFPIQEIPENLSKWEKKIRLNVVIMNNKIQSWKYIGYDKIRRERALCKTIG